MPSFEYKMQAFLIRLLPIKRYFSLPYEKLESVSRKKNAKRFKAFHIPKIKGFKFSDCGFEFENKKWHCLKVSPETKCTENAILFIYGGGMITAPDDSDILPALMFSKLARSDLFFPYYPLCLDYNAKYSINMIYTCYKNMLKEYKAENIRVLAYSSGGWLAFGLCDMLLKEETKLPMFHKMILSSPGGVPSNDKMEEYMKALSKKDIMLDIRFMKNIKLFMDHGENLPQEIFSPWLLDFRGFPHIDFYFSDSECLYACKEAFENACKQAEVSYTMTIGKGLCHCWPFSAIFPFKEQRQAHKKILKQLEE